MDEVALLPLIKRTLNVDLAVQTVRERAWRRIRVFREIADDCEADGNQRMADTLRRICQKATDPSREHLIYLAMLAGADGGADD
jgi:hypothetical protein